MKYILLLMVLVAAMLAVFFSFTSSYMACSEAETRVRHARVQLTHELSRLGELLPNMAALYYRYGTNGPGIVTYAERARAELERQQSPLQMARAHAALHFAMQRMAGDIASHPRARQHLKYRDVMIAFNDTTQRIAYLQEQYNNAVADYNALLNAPQPAFWRTFMGMTNAEPFHISAPAGTSTAHEHQSGAAR